MKVLSLSLGLLWESSLGLQERSLVDYGVIELVVLMGCGCIEQTCLDGLTPYLSEWIEKKKQAASK